MANRIVEGNRIVNGYTIIAEGSVPGGGIVILGMRRHPDRVEYVTAWMENEYADGWSNGHYSGMHFPWGIAAAVEDFQNR